MESRFGLIEVYQPSNSAIARIIFVHGLFGHPYKTWTKQKAHSKREKRQRNGANKTEIAFPSVFWPKDLLPEVIPDVQIYTWGYDADIDNFTSSASQNTVHQHATGLLSDLADLQENDGDESPPFIFVCHSLGGIIVKDALNQSSQIQITRTKRITPKTYAICFLGTPHRGSKAASLGKIAYQASRVAIRRPNRRLLQALERNSETLDRIGHSFLQTLTKYEIQICSFIEEKEVRKWLFFSTVVVNSSSAIISYAREEVGSIPENHSNIAHTLKSNIGRRSKFGNQLRRWIKEIRKPGKVLGVAEYSECISSLDDAISRVRIRAVAVSHKLTFHWLFDENVVKFSQWLRGDDEAEGAMFWIQGKPGSGKSTLMKFAMQNKKTNDLLSTSGDHWIIIGYFFHDRGSDIQKSLKGMLQEILYQMLFHVKQLAFAVQPHWIKLAQAQGTKSPNWDVDGLRGALLSIVKQHEVKAHFCMFIDALDEHDGDNDQLAGILQEMVSDTDSPLVKLKICLASRSWTVFISHFAECPGSAIHNYTRADIQSYTTSRLFEASVGPRQATFNVSLFPRKALVEQVTNKARGVFIWVKLVVDILAKGIRDGTPLSALQETVSQLPEELKDLYLHTLRRIDSEYVEEAYIMLQIALCSTSPLLLETFIPCISFVRWGTLGLPASIDYLVRLLASRSGGLLETISQDLDHELSVEEEEKINYPSLPAEPDETVQLGVELSSDLVVQFVHQTAKEYIRDQRDNLGLRFQNDKITHKSGYIFLLGLAVASYVNSYATFWGIIRSSIGKLVFQYASLAEKETNLDPVGNQYINPALDKLRGCDFVWIASEFEIAQAEREFYSDLFHRQKISDLERPLFLCIAANLHNYISYSINKIPARLLLVAVAVAAFGPKIIPGEDDRLRMMSLLLGSETSSNINSRISNPFRGLGYQGSFSILALLLASKKFHKVEEDQRIVLARFLLQRGADPNAEVPSMNRSPGSMWLTRSTALQHCVLYESLAMVRSFLEHGAKASIYTDDIPGLLSIHPFTLALRRMDPDILRALQEAGYGGPQTREENIEDEVPNVIERGLSTLAGFPAVWEVSKLREARRIESESCSQSVR